MLLKQSPQITFDAIRISRNELRAFIAGGRTPTQRTEPPTGKGEAVRGLPKRKVMAAFQNIKWDYDKWGKNLASPSGKLKLCRIAQGNKKTSALWNPADIGLYLLDEGVKLAIIDPVFIRLNDWFDEWREKTALEQERD